MPRGPSTPLTSTSQDGNAQRGQEGAVYLARAGALLERFDQTRSLQAIVDLAVPKLADWCFLHLETKGQLAIVAVANADPAAAEEARHRAVIPKPLSQDTAVSRVLAGGPPEIVQVDDEVLRRAARDEVHLAQLRSRSYRSAVVAPLAGRDGVLGAVTFAMTESGRRYEDADLDMLVELARRTGAALENARLFEAEQRARRAAEEARDRTRRLQELTAALSRASHKADVVSTMVYAGRDALGAAAGFAWLLRDADTLELAGAEPGVAGRVGLFMTIPLTARLPVCDVIRSTEPMMFENRLAMAAGYPDAIPPGETPFGAWAVIPFVVSGRAVGAVSFSFKEERGFTSEDRALLVAMTGQASLALERSISLEAERRARADAEAAVERARLADRRKDEFLAMLGHELRNPLAPIATALELMDLKPGDAFRREREVIRRQVDHMSRLVDDLLDVSRITRGKIPLEKRPVEIGAVLAKAIEMASPLLEKRAQRLTIDVPRFDLAVEADPDRLAQVFQNLLTNASKYSDPESAIVLRARGDGRLVVVEVADRGMGIAAESIAGLFELFVQGQRTLDRSEGGLGLGLTIAKSLCELHGGSISVASPGVGRGSTFTVTLPRVATVNAPPGPAEIQPRQPFCRSRVLVVDDNVDAAESLHELLIELGHEAAVAHDGVAALEVVRTFVPDVALLDIGLPVMDGYELARRIRAQPGRERMRLIAVTGYGQDADRALAASAGFDHHLVKPVIFDDLIALLNSDAGSNGGAR